MRVKSHWFKSGGGHTPKELAGAVAFTVWRIADNALKQIRQAGFDIAVGEQYFAFLAEFLIFLVQLADRIAYRHLDNDARIAFTIELANRVAETFADNRREWMNGEPAADKAAFIARLNQRADEYANYDYQKDAANFSFIRALGLFMQEVVDEKDRTWVTDQIMAAQAPEAIATLERAMSGLLELEPKRARRPSGGGE
jgi:hypothetical protein